MSGEEDNPEAEILLPRRHLGARVVGWFALVSVILLGIAGLVSNSVGQLISSSTWVAHSYEVLDTLDLTRALFADAQSEERGFVATCKKSLLTPFRSDLPRIYANVANLQVLTADNPTQTRHITRLHTTLSAEIGRMSTAVKTNIMGDQKDAELEIADPADLNATRDILSIIADMEKEERRLLDIRLNDVKYFARLTLGAGVVGIAACFGILGFVFWLIRRETVRREFTEASLQETNERLEGSLGELQRYNDSARAIGLLGELLQTCRNTREALSIAAKHISQLLPDSSGAIGLFSHSRDQIEVAQTFGGDNIFTHDFPPDHCWGLRRGRAHTFVHAGPEPLCDHLVGSAFDFLCIPLIAQGETLGVFSMATPRNLGFTEMERHNLQTVAEQLSLALANLRLQETLRNQSLRDALTGLFNRRYLEDALIRETARARRQKQPLSIVMMDLDHFKRFNDMHGHEGGDVLLSSFGQLLARFVRGEDAACRYGGEEFALILPGTTAEAALARAEELRKAVAALRMTLHGAPLSPVTLSLGVASYPEQGETGAAVLAAADAALYQAKAAGRDRAIRAGEIVRTTRTA